MGAFRCSRARHGHRCGGTGTSGGTEGNGRGTEGNSRGTEGNVGGTKVEEATVRDGPQRESGRTLLRSCCDWLSACYWTDGANRLLNWPR